MRTHTHVGHVTDCNEITGCSQVEAVHSVFHIARYLTVATAEVCNHQRGRSETKDTADVFRNTGKKTSHVLLLQHTYTNSILILQILDTLYVLKYIFYLTAFCKES